MTICFKNQLNALADTHILIDGVSRSWTKGQLFCLAEKLREYATGLDESHTAHTNRCLLLCEGTTSDIAVYIAAVIGGITVAPYSPSAFLRDPRYAIESIKPSLAIAPARFHKALMEDNIPYIFSQDDIVNVTTKADQAPTRDKEGWSLELDMEAYIIPTSGSTGRPKFVPITYRNIVSWATHNLPALQLDSTSRFGGTYPLYFDASAMFIFGSLFTGCTLTIPEKHQALTPLTFAVRERVTHWVTVPSAWEYSRRAEPNAPICETAQTIGLGGEAVSPFTASQFISKFPRSEVVNLYGPAETTIFIAHRRFSPSEINTYLGRASLPVSPPTFPWHMNVAQDLDSSCKIGELIIGGSQVFNGYLNNQSQQNDKLSDGFMHTGDIFSYEEGLLHYHGRTDNQVKIRGQRTTIETIESVIVRDTGVSNACCRLSTQVDADIDILYCGSKRSKLDIEKTLEGVLPLRIRVGLLIHVPLVPTTANGKTDRKAAQEMLCSED